MHLATTQPLLLTHVQAEVHTLVVEYVQLLIQEPQVDTHVLQEELTTEQQHVV